MKKYNNAKCAECGKPPRDHHIRMEKPHGFELANG